MDAADIEVHAWMWTMPNNNPYYLEKHPEWYSVKRAGLSSATDPAHVPYYRFMCSSNEGIPWVGAQLEDKIALLKEKKPVYSGLFITSVSPQGVVDRLQYLHGGRGCRYGPITCADLTDEH